MKKVYLLLIFIFCCVTNRLLSQADSAAMKTWMANMTPGDVHKMIAKADGQWKVETTLWMTPGQPPVKSNGTSTNKMILGGRYQQSEFKGDMMGMPFEGMSLLGYDNADKTFTSTWMDNMGTGTMTLKGTWDDATKSINFKGNMLDQMTNKSTDVREVFTIVDDNNQKMEMYAAGPDGKEYKSMEIKFTRM